MVGDIRNELVLVKEKDGSKNGSGILAKWTELRAGSKPSSSINFSFDPFLYRKQFVFQEKAYFMNHNLILFCVCTTLFNESYKGASFLTIYSP